ncbi:MAG: nitrogen regulatory protein 1 [Frankiales bacterium]|nr:nitrogen regulatory protein 1 [Frankiales bacterium]
MKQITAIIKPFQLEGVRAALPGAGVGGMTVSEVVGHGRQRGHTEVYRGAEYTVDLIPKLRLDILVEDADAVALIELITAAARTGAIGDGKVWSTTIDLVIRIRTGEVGSDAL